MAINALVTIQANTWLTDNLDIRTEAQETIWALEDVSFEIKQGEVVGIIGRNGAGKSTLLKILSRITEPTRGEVILRGRVGSLLEVGTGFHPELTGRENIYLNGAILGMRRAEIAQRFDEIVDFAEVDKFIDTPVKHYSSGMYMRLAFAVAAHMESEILLVDEVLSVGDLEFQKKCLGKMSDMATTGRTVLFVSHNIAAIQRLTTKCCLLDKGKLIDYTSTSDAIYSYFESTSTNLYVENAMVGKHTKIYSVRLLDSSNRETELVGSGDNLFVEVDFSTDGTPSLSLELFLETTNGERIGMVSLFQFYQIALPTTPNRYKCLLEIAALNLASGRYFFTVKTSFINIDWDVSAERIASFQVQYSNLSNPSWNFNYEQGLGSLALSCVNQPEFSVA